MSNVQAAPKSLNEWTLEMSITHEIANMFDSVFGIFYPIRLRKMFDILPVDLSRIKKRKTRISKLTPREEGAGGGWDTSLTIPTAKNKDDRIIYFQFKSGEHRSGNRIPGSLFNIGIKNPNNHIEFSFNDNGDPKKGKRGSQHDDLKRLSDYLGDHGLSKKSVLYAFPRITSLEDFNELDSPLILRTTFLSVDQMDAQAKANGVSLHDGKLHHFRTCYIKEDYREISSEPVSLLSEDTSNVLKEIILVKLSRIWNDYINNINNEKLKDYLNLSASTYLQVNPFDADEYPFYSYESGELDFLKDRYNTKDLQYPFRRQIFENVYNFVIGLQNRVDTNQEIPSVYSSILSQVARRPYSDISGDLGSASVTSIVF